MNKTQIPWCDYTWNPVTGCFHACEYCYARRQAKRFCGDIRRNKKYGDILAYKGEDMTDKECYVVRLPIRIDGQPIYFPAGFMPTFYEYRLSEPAERKKPANIFVCSMADLFGDWVPESWILRVFEACDAAPWHNYLFLTKNPKRYCDLANAGLLPRRDNFWYGTTVTRKEDRIFGGSVSYNTFLNV